MPKFIVFLGPPGAGKGTQAQLVAKEFDFPHISSGDIFRENIKNGTDLGLKAKGYMDRGDLVPDELTISMVQERLEREDCRDGAILDGFPRTPAQAKSLEKILADLGGQVNIVPFINVPEEVLVRRLSGRWICRAEGHVFHELHNPPKKAGICDYDGSELYQREDDEEETVKNRIKVYFQKTRPLIEYYQTAGLLKEIDGDKPINDVVEELKNVISQAI
jgi:adenylate kinase